MESLLSRTKRDVLLALACTLTLAMARPSTAMPTEPTAGGPAPLVLVYNKQNPRWEAPGQGPRHQFTKPYKPLHLPPENLPPRRHAVRDSKVLNRFVVLALVGVVITALAAEWLSASVRLPSAWIALLGGLVLGPVSGLFNPAMLLGNAWLPLVALFLVVLLFQDLLRARVADVGTLGAVVARLVCVDTLIISVGAAVIAAIIGLPPAPAALLAAILVSAHRAAGSASSEEAAPLLAWEGTFLEIVGIAFALVISEVVLGVQLHRDSGPAVVSVATSVIGGSLAGVVLAYAVTRLLSGGWIAEPARPPLLLAATLTALALPNLLHDGCGFFAVLALGLCLANQRQVNLVTTGGTRAVPPAVISGLLIVLAASVRLDEMTPVDTAAVVSLVVLLFAARLATWRARLPWREQLVLAGDASTTAIGVAAATVCALRLGERGVPQAPVVATLTVLVVFIRLSVASVANVFEARWWRAAAARPEVPRQVTPATL